MHIYIQYKCTKTRTADGFCEVINEDFFDVISGIGSDDRLLFDDNILYCVVAHDNGRNVERINSVYSNLSNALHFGTVDQM